MRTQGRKPRVSDVTQMKSSDAQAEGSISAHACTRGQPCGSPRGKPAGKTRGKPCDASRGDRATRRSSGESRCARQPGDAGSTPSGGARSAQDPPLSPESSRPAHSVPAPAFAEREFPLALEIDWPLHFRFRRRRASVVGIICRTEIQEVFLSQQIPRSHLTPAGPSHPSSPFRVLDN